MIVPMYKYTFAVYHREYDDFLSKLASLGVVDVSINKNDVDDIVRSKMLLISQLTDVVKFLRTRNQPLSDIPVKRDGIEVMNEVKELQSQLEKVIHRQGLLKKELTLAEPWGDYSADLIRKIHEAGYTLRFYITPERKFITILQDQPGIIEISRYQNNVYFVQLSRNNEIFSIETDEIKIPDISPEQLRKAYEESNKEIAEINDKLNSIAAKYLPALNESRQRVLGEINYQQVLIKTVKEAEEKLFILTGYTPVTHNENLEKYLESSNIIYYKDRPVPHDNPPIYLKNGWFARLFEPIGEIFSLPNYREMDLTPFFAPFYMMFFGFCMGDVAYGLVLLLMGLFLRNRVSPTLRVYLTLAIFLGIATIIFGIIGGTIAGFDMEAYALYSPLHKYMLSDTQIFYFALILGLIQVVYGMVIQAYRKAVQFGFKYAIATIGVIVSVLAVVDMTLLKLTSISQYILYGGIALMFLFSDPDINIFARLGKGVWDLYSNVTGIFGDVLSYIRLFALSASSGILGFVINSISLPLLDSVPVLGHILFIIVMLVGHGANLALAGLGAFVHPMRLTFVEFYKNAGFEGGGNKYTPYSK